MNSQYPLAFGRRGIVTTTLLGLVAGHAGASSAPVGQPGASADEIAAAAELVKGNTSRIPVAPVRGVDHVVDETATMAPVLRDTSRDLFR